jgi:hypothetical protein
MLEELVDHRSGLLGILGAGSDMRRLHEAASSNADHDLQFSMPATENVHLRIIPQRHAYLFGDGAHRAQRRSPHILPRDVLFVGYGYFIERGFVGLVVGILPRAP